MIKFQSTGVCANLLWMLKIAHRFLVVLIAFAIVGGSAEQLARSTQYAVAVTMAGMPCDMEMPGVGADQAKPLTSNDGMPCKGMTPDCIKQMGCVTVAALPAPVGGSNVAMRFSTIEYWTARSALVGLVREPEPLPPRTI